MQTIVEKPESPAQQDGGKPHLAYIDGLRALAALVVAVGHTATVIWPSDSAIRPWYYNRLWQSFITAHFAVSLFIVISGFCLMLPVAQKGLLIGGASGFYKRRARRILPTYYAALLISIVEYCIVSRLSLGQLFIDHWQALAANVFLLNDMFYKDAFNGVLWSVAVECKIYILFPLIVASWKKLGILATLAWTFVLGYSLYYFTNGTDLFWAMPHYIFLFALGAFAALICFAPARSTLSRMPFWLCLACVLTLAARVCVYQLGWPAVMDNIGPYDFVVGIASAAWLIAANQKGPLQSFLSCRPLIWIGAMAYSLYVIHIPVCRLPIYPFNQLAHLSDFQKWLVYPLEAVTIIALAFLFHLAAEKPFMSRRKAAPDSRTHAASSRPTS